MGFLYSCFLFFISGAMNRKDRIDKILETLKKNGGSMTLKELRGPLLFEWGLRKETFWTYLETLREASKIDYPTSWLEPKEPHIVIKLEKKT